MIEHRRHCPICNAMRPFHGDLSRFDAHSCTVPLTCGECGHTIAAAVPRSEIEPRLGIYPR